MAGVYRPRHPERTVLYRVLFHHFDRFLTEYESRFERESIIRICFSGSVFAFFVVIDQSPSGRKYISGVVKLGDSSVGAGIRGITEKRNTYPYHGVSQIVMDGRVLTDENIPLLDDEQIHEVIVTLG